MDFGFGVEGFGLCLAMFCLTLDIGLATGSLPGLEVLLTILLITRPPELASVASERLTLILCNDLWKRVMLRCGATGGTREC